MTLDIDYLKKILLAFEASKRACTGVLEFQEHDLGHTTEKFAFHMLLLADMSLIETEAKTKDIGFQRYADGTIGWYNNCRLRLTALGHDFTTGLRNDTVWERVKNEFHDQSIATLVNVTKALSGHVISNRIKAQSKSVDSEQPK